jgi:hypothetical protein
MRGALRRLPKVKLPELPRMADFAMWATAAESLLGWREGAFLRAYTRNQASSNELARTHHPSPSRFGGWWLWTTFKVPLRIY